MKDNKHEERLFPRFGTKLLTLRRRENKLNCVVTDPVVGKPEVYTLEHVYKEINKPFK